MLAKLALLMLSAIVLSSQIRATTQYRDLFLGYKVQPEIFLQQKEIKVTAIPSRFVTRTVTLEGNRRSRITRLQAFDRDMHGCGANVNVTHGGIGSTFATLHFQSQKGCGIDFLVNIYQKWK